MRAIGPRLMRREKCQATDAHRRSLQTPEVHPLANAEMLIEA